MVRIASYGGAIELDWDATARGRGGYLHLDPCCLDKFIKSRLHRVRSLKALVTGAERRRIVEALRSRAG